MLNNLKLSSKMHILIIVSCIVIALGLAVGTICNFVSKGFFNYADDYESYNSVTVSYEDIDFSGKDKEPVEIIGDICDKAFSSAGVSSYTKSFGETTTGGEIVYKFSTSTDLKKLESATETINTSIASEVSENGGIQLSYASYQSAEGVLGGGKAITLASITIAVMVVFHFLYFVIRYKLTMALGALLADVHNFALYIALIALCRIPVGSSIATFAVITEVLTIIGTCFLFDRMRKNCKDENLKKLTAFELSDKSANESLILNTVMPACLAGVSVVLFVLMSISSLSPITVLSSVLCSLVAFISCAYGTAIFTPSVYSRFKKIGDDIKKKSAEKSKNVGK